MSTNPDPRKAAEESLQSLVAAVQAQPPSETREAFLAECAALAVAIRAFHMEGIRFRMFNVDRTIARGAVPFTDSRARRVRRRPPASRGGRLSHPIASGAGLSSADGIRDRDPGCGIRDRDQGLGILPAELDIGSPSG